MRALRIAPARQLALFACLARVCCWSQLGRAAGTGPAEVLVLLARMIALRSRGRRRAARWPGRAGGRG